MAEKGLVITGARARLTIGGQKVGYCSGVNLEEMINYEPYRALDNITVEEHVPVTYDCSMSARMARLVTKSITALGMFPKKGKSSADFLKNILLSGELNAVVEDSKTGKAIAAVESVRVQRMSYSVDAGGASMQDVQFVCVLIRDEAET